MHTGARYMPTYLNFAAGLGVMQLRRRRTRRRQTAGSYMAALRGNGDCAFYSRRPGRVEPPNAAAVYREARKIDTKMRRYRVSNGIRYRTHDKHRV